MTEKLVEILKDESLISSALDNDPLALILEIKKTVENEELLLEIEDYYQAYSQNKSPRFKTLLIRSIQKIDYKELMADVPVSDEILSNVIQDLVSNFVYYDRKSDEDLTVDQLQNFFNSDPMALYKCVSLFKKHLEDKTK